MDMDFDDNFSFDVSTSDEESIEEAEVKEVHKGSETEQLNDFFDKPKDPIEGGLGFSQLNLSKPLLKACAAVKYKAATSIQAAAIPLILSGRDICGSAITGSGKTAAFVLPLLERLLYRPRGIKTTYVLIVAPTRELAIQIHSAIRDLAKFTDIQAALIVGGFSLQVQAATLETRPEIVVATPGRLIDHLRNSKSFDLDEVHAVVLDEADKLLKLGFINEIQEILRNLPNKRQTMLFSATMTEEVKKLVKLSLNKPVRIAADPTGRVPKKLVQEIIRVEGEETRKKKEALLCALCSESFSGGGAIVFCSTKRRAHRIKLLFDMLKLPPTGELHANMSQSDRLDSLEKFRNGEFSFLVATDVAGRGLDISGVEIVINYDAPKVLDTYLHRIGRTARAGASGLAVTFINDTNLDLLKEIRESTKEDVRHRNIPEDKISFFDQQIQLHSRHLKLVEKKEWGEEKFKRAEMEIERAKNMIEHESEIMARPPRTWFQTKEERKRVRNQARVEEDGVAGSNLAFPAEDRMVTPSKSTKKKQKKGENLSNPAVEETRGIKGAVRAIKKQHRLLETKGFTSRAASKAAIKSVKNTDAARDGRAYPKTGPQKKSTSWETQNKTKVYSGGAKSGRVLDRSIDKRRLNSVKRKGKGKHSFKGKRKYKRR